MKWIKDLFGLCFRSIRRSCHDYQYVSKGVKEIVTVKYYDGTETINAT